MSKKKHYNPFKMWGSYAGASILILSPLFVVFILPFYNLPQWILTFNAYFFSGVLGFLIGWGIHSVIRRAL